MPEPQNNFLVFNEANNPDLTMSDEDYANDSYRRNGLIPMIADPVAHNKMFRQWSIMCRAIAEMIRGQGHDALDTNITDLKNNFKSSIEEIASAEATSALATKSDVGHTHTLSDITDVETTANELNVLHGLTATAEELNTLDGISATTAELNCLSGVDSNIQTQLDDKSDVGHIHGIADITDINVNAEELNALHGLTANTTELNILDGADISTNELNALNGVDSNIQQQINSITGVIGSPFPAWSESTPYEVGDICIANTFKSYQYLECVVAGTSGSTTPLYADVGQMVTDNEVKWLACDFRDSNPVGTFRADVVQRKGWLKANGATVNRADYPRLWNWVVDNSLTTNDQESQPGRYGTGDGSTTFTLPNYEDYFIRYSFTRVVGAKQNSQMAQHNHSCGNQDTSHTHTLGNQSANHKHSCSNQSANHTHSFTSQSVNVQSGSGASIATIGGNGSTTTSGMSGNHNHTLGNQDTSHTHSIGNQSANHKHSIGNTGSGDNTYPTNIAMEMYIKY